jgi:hypothetical protein
MPSSFYALYPLQSLTEFQIQPNPKGTIAFIIGFILLAGIIIFLNVSKAVKRSAAFRGQPVNIPLLKKFAKASFFKLAKHYKLNKSEAIFLEKKLIESGAQDIVSILRSKEKTGEYFKRIYQQITREQQPEETEAELSRLFDIRNTIEYFQLAADTGQGNHVMRNFRRKQNSTAVHFFLVIRTQKKSGFKTVKKLILENNTQYEGTMFDVSLGGCSFSSNQSIKAGSLVKIEFNAQKANITALCQVMRINKNNKTNVYHVKFLKLSKKSILALNVFVFDY